MNRNSREHHASSQNSALRLSDIAPAVIQSEIRAMSVECDRVGGINLAQGICDTELPLPVANGAIDAIHAGHNIYTRLDGIATLRQSIAEKLQQYNGITADPDTQILVTNGATGALYASCFALLNPRRSDRLRALLRLSRQHADFPPHPARNRPTHTA